MILSICPNPSIDCTIELDNLNVGMLNRIRSKTETYSGKALNVAIGVARLGEKSIATGFMAKDHAKMFEQVLEKEGVGYDFIYNEGSARVNYKIIDKRSMLTEINDKGALVDRERQLELINKVRELSPESSIAVMSGSLPDGVESTFYKETISVIPNRVKIVVDAEKENTLSALSTGREIFMVKPNVIEFENFTETKVGKLSDMVVSSRKYLDMGVKYVLISLGADGAVLTDGNEGYYCKSTSVAVNSTVGAGDSMVAAACVFFEKGVSVKEVLRCSVAAGTAAITTSGTNLFYKEKFDEIYTKVQAEKIIL